jgi:polysaccharide export outer membrane protein
MSIRPVLAVIGLLPTILSGCSVTGNVPFFPTRYPLTDASFAASLGPPVDAPREFNKTTTGDYVVEPGDSLIITPVDLDSRVRLSTDQPVLPDGTVDLSKYGRWRVAGKTLDTIENEITKLITDQEMDEWQKEMNEKGLTKKELPPPKIGAIDVRLGNRQSKAYYVLGEVTTPGRFNLAGYETVLDAIIAAGGLTDRSSFREIVLVRPKGDGPGEVLRVDYLGITQLGLLNTNYQIKPGDRVIVPTRNFWDGIFGFDRIGR